MYLEKNAIYTSYIYPTHDRSTYVRKIAHGLKKGNEQAIKKAACAMAKNIKAGSVLVPIPSANGYADATLKLALALREVTDEKIHVADILFSAPRMSHYLSKKRGIALSIEAMAMHVKAHAIPHDKLILVDNVADTGKTIMAARKALTVEAPALVFAASVEQVVHNLRKEKTGIRTHANPSRFTLQS